MKNTKGFTLIEMMVTILVFTVLIVVAIPILRGRSDAAKWSEAKSAMGAIATTMRAYAAEKRDAGAYPLTLAELGFIASDLHGTYFTIANYSIPSCTYTAGATPELTYIIRCDNTATGISSPSVVELNEAGSWTP